MASKLNYTKLLDEVRSGKTLSPNSLREIRSQLASGDPSVDPYQLIYIIGRSGDLDSKSVVEPYLDYSCPDDRDNAALVRRIAVQVLGGMWGLRDYFPIIAAKAFNEDPYVRAVAATSLASLAVRHPELRQQTAALLLQGFNLRDLKEPEVWESFYYALLELLETPVDQWPPATRPLRDIDVDPEVIRRAKKISEQ